MRKKFIAMLLMVGMIISLCACSQESSTTNSKGESTDASTVGDNSAFDEYARPVVKESGLTLAYIHNFAYNEAEQRKMGQIQLECDNRGWKFVEANYTEDSEWSDAFKNLINQGVDVIVITNTESMQAKSGLIIQARNEGIGVYCCDSEVVPGIIANATMPNGVATEELFYKIGNDYKWTENLGFLTAETFQVHTERVDPAVATCKSYANLNVYEVQDVLAGGSDFITYSADLVKAWLQKYGTELTGVYTSSDTLAFAAAEAAEQSGDLVSEDFFVSGIDGGSECWAKIREGSYFKYSYAQPFELYAHKLCDIIEQIQVMGLNPGDEGCDIDYSGDILYSYGKVITRNNVPDVGANVHTIFDYYDSDPDSWCNWEGTYTVSE